MLTGAIQDTKDHLPGLAARFQDWLMEKALPLWWEQGGDRRHGGFHDALDAKGPIREGDKRARVQGRQSWVYAVAGSLGWKGPWEKAARHGLDFLFDRHCRGDGQIVTLVAADGRVKDETATLYDQTFFLLALSEAAKSLPQPERYAAAAHRLMDTIILARSHAGGGFVEHAQDAFQSNPHMHLLEAALAWGEVEPKAIWDKVADEVAHLALTRLVDPQKGAMREFFDAEWRPLTGERCTVEPGHQFEWAWLLHRWGKRSGRDGAQLAALRLYEVGCLGVDEKRGVAVDGLHDDFSVARPTARLWPQTERIKAALALMAGAEGAERACYRGHALSAMAALWRYLEMDVEGLWRDRMHPDASFIEEPSPASSLYHIVCAIKVMGEHIRA